MEESAQGFLTVKEVLVALRLYFFAWFRENKATANAIAVKDYWTLQFALVHPVEWVGVFSHRLSHSPFSNL